MMKVLIADDDPITLEAVETCLVSEGFTPLPARNGEEALQLYQQHHPALICLDIMMPVLDGFEVCKRIRKQDAHTPVLFLSAKNEEIDVVVGLELGADDFVRKPFGKRELLARVRAALRRPATASSTSSQPDRIPFGPWHFFPKQLRATHEDGREIELSPREVTLLACLHERAGEAVHRDTLLEQCWGLDYYPESRTLDQHIAKLRKKIERDPADPQLIETIRGVGYRHRNH